MNLSLEDYKPTMSTQGDKHQDLGQPPSYHDLNQNEVFQLTILVLSGQALQTESTDSGLLYKLDVG